MKAFFGSLTVIHPNNLLVLILLLIVLVIGSSGSGTAEVDGQAVITRYNTRQIGAPGLQRIQLEIGTGASVTTRYELMRIFSQSGDTTATIVVVAGAGPLVGTAVLLVEQTGVGIRDVFLYIPAGTKQTIRLETSRHSERLLGSDFTYRDLGWTLPVRGWRYQVAPEATSRDSRKVDVDAVEETFGRAAYGRHQKLTFGVEDNNLLSRVYVKSAGASIHASLGHAFEVERTDCISGVTTPTRISVKEGRDWSRLTLLESRLFLSGLQSTRLTPALLPTSAEFILEHWAHDASQRGMEARECEK